MYPVDFEELFWAVRDQTTIPLLRRLFELRQPVGEAAHRRIMRQFRLYMLVGGMPQSVAAYIGTNSFRKADEVKRDILNLYEDDFRKIDSTGRLSLLFEAIPAQLNKNASRY